MTYANENWLELSEIDRTYISGAIARLERAMTYGADMTGSAGVALDDAQSLINHVLKRIKA